MTVAGPTRGACAGASGTAPRPRRGFGLSALGILLGCVLVSGLALAQDDRFAFMPPGGVQLLQQALEACERCDPLSDLATRDLPAEEWRGYFDEHGALEEWSDEEVATLVTYLAVVFPADAVESVEDAPRDGRAIVIEQCQLCHAIAIPMQEDRPMDDWLQHIQRPPHDALGLDETDWQLLASYLANNAPIPQEDIPAQFRRGAGGY